MCRRFKIESDDLKSLKVVKGYETLSKTFYDVKVGEDSPVLTVSLSALKLSVLTFGINIYGKTIYNARIETIAEKDLFSDAFKNRRCLVPVSSFFEDDDYKIEHQFYQKDQKPFYLCGICLDQSFVLLTSKPDEAISYYHKRMPLALSKEDAKRYLNTKTGFKEILSFNPVSLFCPDSSSPISLF